MGGIDLAAWLNLKGSPFEALPLFVTSLAIGLLMGVERERKHHTLAGIRTFPLTSILGTLTAMLDAPSHGVLLQTVGLLAVASCPNAVANRTKPSRAPPRWPHCW